MSADGFYRNERPLKRNLLDKRILRNVKYERRRYYSCSRVLTKIARVKK